MLTNARLQPTGRTHTRDLERVILDGAGIAEVDGGDAVARALPALLELDISRSLLRSWGDAGRLGEQLPKLTSMNLSGCRLDAGQGVAESVRGRLARLTSLGLNSVRGVSWADVMALVAETPELTALHFCHNGVTSLVAGGALPPKLRFLNVEGNALTSWRDVEAGVGRWPALAKLHVSDNPGLSFAAPAPGAFAALTTLFMMRCGIEEWAGVGAMAHLPALTELALNENPIGGAALHPDDRRGLIMARVVRITRLNRSAVRPLERRDAEVDYFHRCLAEHSAGASLADLRAQHPRFDEIAAAQKFDTAVLEAGLWHDRAAEARAADVKIASRLVEVQLTLGERTIKKRLPRTMTVAKLTVLCKRLFRIPGVASLTIPDAARVLELENEFRDISFYGLESGDRLIVVATEG